MNAIIRRGVGQPAVEDATPRPTPADDRGPRERSTPPCPPDASDWLRAAALASREAPHHGVIFTRAPERLNVRGQEES